MVLRHLVMGSFALVLCFASAVTAQTTPDSIPGDVIRATSLSGTQQAAINTYVRYWVDQLTKGDNSQVVVAREKLINPLKRGGTPVFTDTYDKEVATHLGAGTTSEKVLVRINTMIVAKELSDDKVDEMVVNGVTDKSAPVGYLAAKAAENLLGADDAKVNRRRKDAIFDAVAKALIDNGSPWVFEQQGRAIIAYGQTKGYIVLLDALNKRVPGHVAKPVAEISVELSLLNGMFVKLVDTMARQGKEVDQRVLIQLCRAAYRFGIISVNHRAAGINDKDVESLYSQLTDLSSKILIYIAGKVDPAAQLPAPWERAQLPIQQLALNDFSLVLQRVKFALEEKDLALKPAAP